jgi:glycolate oxidase FAD binding subunit
LTETFTPATQSELARYLADNAAGPKRILSPVGGRTALHAGYPGRAAQVLIDATPLNRVIDYPARDMTVTVEAGIRIDALQSLLKQEGQRLPVDVAQPSRATLGGAIATNTSGPRRAGYGTFRDYVIGVSAVDASGRLFKGGGRVVKNVAGYDLCKLLVGSQGTLAVISQVTLKLRPLPETSALLWLTFDTFGEIENALERLLVSDARPVAVDVLNSLAANLIAAQSRLELPRDTPVLLLGVEGSPREVDWQIERLRRELVPYGVNLFEKLADRETAGLWDSLTDFQTSADDPLTFQANLLPSRCMEFAERATALGVAVQVHAASGIVIGQCPESTATAEQAATLLADLRTLARSGKGNLTVLHCDEEWQSLLPMWGDPEPSWPLMAQLKRKLDPDGLLNPGRFVDGYNQLEREELRVQN